MGTTCCDQMSFQQLAKGPSACVGGVEFTLGFCKRCGQFLIHWRDSEKQGHEPVSENFAQLVAQASDAEARQRTLKQWWDGRPRQSLSE